VRKQGITAQTAVEVSPLFIKTHLLLALGVQKQHSMATLFYKKLQIEESGI